jgi:hypothetical protein
VNISIQNVVDAAMKKQMCIFYLNFFSRKVWFYSSLKADMLNHNLHPTDIIQQILSMKHPELNLSTTFTILWNIWKSSNDLLFEKKTQSPLQVIHASKEMLSAG